MMLKNIHFEDYQRIFNEIQDGYLQSDMEGSILLVNPATLRGYGYDSPEELSGKNITHAIYVDPRIREELKAILLQQGHIKGFEIKFKRKNGEHITAELAEAKEQAEAEEKIAREFHVTTEQLRALPAELLNQLHKAAIELDEVKSLKIIEQITLYDSDTGDSLKAFVNQLEFRRLLDLLHG